MHSGLQLLQAATATDTTRKSVTVNCQQVRIKRPTTPDFCSLHDFHDWRHHSEVQKIKQLRYVSFCYCNNNDDDDDDDYDNNNNNNNNDDDDDDDNNNTFKVDGACFVFWGLRIQLLIRRWAS
jgi:hypothetical protein